MGRDARTLINSMTATPKVCDAALCMKDYDCSTEVCFALQGGTLLHAAAGTGDHRIVRTLLAHGADHLLRDQARGC